MKEYFYRKRVAAVLFLLFLFLFGWFNFKNLQKEWEVCKTVKEAELLMNSNVIGRYGFIEGYGYIHRLLNKSEMNNFEVIKNESGYLAGTSFQSGPYYETGELAARVGRLRDEAEKGGVRTVVFLPPVRYGEGAVEPLEGMPYNYLNETADIYTRLLAEEGIAVMDCRKEGRIARLSVEEIFYKTDHHWKIPAAFIAFGDFVEFMNENFQAGWDEDSFYRKEENYNVYFLKQSFLGSYGRKTGVLYGGLDDFTYLYPSFPTSLEYEYGTKDGKEQLSGRFEEVLLSAFSLEGTIYQNDRYALYLGGVRSFDKIKNNRKEKGSRILMIRDSFMSPVAAFLSSVCGQVDMLYPLGWEGDIEEYIRLHKESYDYIVLAINPENLTLESFPFFETEHTIHKEEAILP